MDDKDVIMAAQQEQVQQSGKQVIDLQKLVFRRRFENPVSEIFAITKNFSVKEFTVLIIVSVLGAPVRSGVFARTYLF